MEPHAANATPGTVWLVRSEARRQSVAGPSNRCAAQPVPSSHPPAAPAPESSPSKGKGDPKRSLLARFILTGVLKLPTGRRVPRGGGPGQGYSRTALQFSTNLRCSAHVCPKMRSPTRQPDVWYGPTPSVVRNAKHTRPFEALARPVSISLS